MDEIQPYHPAMGKQKVCWFPFKKAYCRRRVKPGLEDTPNAYIIDNKDGEGMDPIEVSLYQVDESDPHGDNKYRNKKFNNAHSKTTELSKPPSDMDKTANNSIVSDEEDEDEDEIVFGDMESLQLASINPNCMAKEFWVDEMVEGGSLSCTENFLHAGRSFTRIGRSCNSYGSRSLTTGLGESTIETDSRHIGLEDSTMGTQPRVSDDPSFRRISTPAPYARIEVEYDFSKRDVPFNSVKGLDPIERGACGAIMGRNNSKDRAQEGPSQTEASSTRKSTKARKVDIRAPQVDRTSLTDKSSISNSTYTTPSERKPLHMQNSISRGRDASMKVQSMKQKVAKLVEPLEPGLKRGLCGAMGQRPCRNARLFQQQEHCIQEEKKSEEEATSVNRESSPSSSTAKKDNLPGPVAWLKTTSFDSLRIPHYAKNFDPEMCAMGSYTKQSSQQTTVDDAFEPRFFVEVEATERQLREVKDWEDITNAEETAQGLEPDEIELARTASLVDDDSAFMEKGQCGVGLLKNIASRRLSATNKGTSVPLGLRYEANILGRQKSAAISRNPESKQAAAAGTPLRGKDTISKASPPLTTPDHKTPCHDGYSTEFGSSGEQRKVADDLAALEGPVPSLGLEKFARSSSILYKEPAEDQKDPDASSNSEAMSTGSRERKRSQPIKARAAGVSKAVEWLEESSSEIPMHQESDESTGWESTQKGSTAESNPSKRRDQAKNKRDKSPDRIEYRIKYLEKGGNTDMVTGIGQDISEDFTHDLELARFPSLTSEDWRNTEIENIKAARLRSRNGIWDNESAGISKKNDYGFGQLSTKKGEHTGTDLKSKQTEDHAEYEEEDWAKSFLLRSAPSLNESFHNAVPFVSDSSSVEGNFDRPYVFDPPGFASEESRSHWPGRSLERDAEHRNMTPLSVHRRERVRGNRVEEEEEDQYDDSFYDESDFNTEAFQRPSMEDDDEDSIFNGLVEHRPSVPQARNSTRDRDGPPLRFETEPFGVDPEPVVDEGSNGSLTSENSMERSKHTSFTKFSKYSRGDYSRVRSIMSRDDMTSYTEAYSVVNEPFNCMDRWLD